MKPQAWHAHEAAQVAAELKTDLRRGLSSGEAAKRLAQHGPNELKKEEGVSP